LQTLPTTKTLNKHIKELDGMKTYPKELFYMGNLELLNKPKISIVGTRAPNQYTKNTISSLSSSLSKNGICIVSGGAMGVDAIASLGAGADNTIVVLANSLDMLYPATNKKLLEQIANKGLIISKFDINHKPRVYDFVQRNEIVVALGDSLIIGEADLKSGTLHSASYGQKMNKDIYTLPHRLNESLGSNELLAQSKAQAIYNIDNFVYECCNKFDILKNSLKQKENAKKDDKVTKYFKTNPRYDDAIAKYPNEVLEYELSLKIKVQNNSIVYID
jgi:DNA processing protein